MFFKLFTKSFDVDFEKYSCLKKLKAKLAKLLIVDFEKYPCFKNCQ